jgi:flagellar protein FlgJ
MAKIITSILCSFDFKHTKTFMETFVPVVEYAYDKYRFNPKPLLSQIALETDWGRKIIGNNIFGIKATTDWKGEIVSSLTVEYIKGVKKFVKHNFRKYANYMDCIDDYVKMISENANFKYAFSNLDNPIEYITGLTDGGYATDPKYGDKLRYLLNKFNVNFEGGEKNEQS